MPRCWVGLIAAWLCCFAGLASLRAAEVSKAVATSAEHDKAPAATGSRPAAGPGGKSSAAAPRAKRVARPPQLGRLPPQRLEPLVAGIALYPDALVEQILAASTTPGDIFDAIRSLDASRSARQKWPASVRLLNAYPEVLVQLQRDLPVTARLGMAVSEQRDDVQAAILSVRMQIAIAAAADLAQSRAEELELTESAAYESAAERVIERLLSSDKAAASETPPEDFSLDAIAARYESFTQPQMSAANLALSRCWPRMQELYGGTPTGRPTPEEEAEAAEAAALIAKAEQIAAIAKANEDLEKPNRAAIRRKFLQRFGR